jgi:hypothetical protein
VELLTSSFEAAFKEASRILWEVGFGFDGCGRSEAAQAVRGSAAEEYLRAVITTKLRYLISNQNYHHLKTLRWV